MPKSGRTKTEERHLALDNLCRLAARATGAPIVVIVEWIDRHAAQIRGAIGTNVRRLTGNHRVPQLRRSDRPIVAFANLRARSWFAQHALQSIDPYAKALIAADIAIPGSESEAALIAFNPSSQGQRDGSTIALLSELASLAGFLLAAVDTVDRVKSNMSGLRLRGGADARPGFQDDGTTSDGDFLSMADPLLFFLRKTLVRRRALRARKTVHYVTLRQWKEAVKDAQIAALRAIKSRPSAEAVRLIAAEIVEAANELYPGMQFSCVVPVPCGSSGRDDCLSVLIARHAAEMFSVPLRTPLRGQKTPGASHPYKSAKMKSYELVEEVTGNILLVDDVATTGTHISLAATALRSKGATVFAIAWIAG